MTNPLNNDLVHTSDCIAVHAMKQLPYLLHKQHRLLAASRQGAYVVAVRPERMADGQNDTWRWTTPMRESSNQASAQAHAIDAHLS